MPRKVYLEDIPLDEARRRFDVALAAADACQPMAPERVLVGEALGRDGWPGLGGGLQSALSWRRDGRGRSSR